MKYNLKNGLFGLLRLVSIYYSSYGLFVLFSSKSTYALQNPSTPIYLKLADEALVVLLLVHLIFLLNNRFLIFVSLIISLIISVITFRLLYGHGVSYLYFKSLLISVIFLFSIRKLNGAQFLNLVRFFINVNALMCILSMLYFLLFPYFAYGGRLLGSYANPNTSALMYLIILSVLLLFGREIFRSRSKVGILVFIFLTGLLTTFSKAYIGIFVFNALVTLPVLSALIACFMFISLLIILYNNFIAQTTLDNFMLVFNQFSKSNTVSQRSLDYRKFIQELGEGINVLLGRHCSSCGDFFSDSSFINVISSSGLLVGSLFLFSPIL